MQLTVQNDFKQSRASTRTISSRDRSKVETF